MTTFPAAHFLMEFGADAISGAALAAREAEAPVDTAPRITEEELAAAVAEAYARGKAEGLAAGLEAMDARLADESRRSAETLTAAREAWATVESKRFSDEIGAAMSQIASEVAGATARILRPFLHQAVSRDAVSELAAALKDLVVREPGVELAVSGPEDLLSRLRDDLAGTAASLKISTTEGTDIRVAAGKSVLETRLKAWAGKLDEAFK